MIIAITGSVGSGKTTLANYLGEKLEAKVIHMNDNAKLWKIEEVDELQTFDFDLDKTIRDVEVEIMKNTGKDLIVESHFAHFINPDHVDKLIVVNRDLKNLKNEYEVRGYNEQKTSDNLEVESFNLCFYEAIENKYDEGRQLFCIENDEDIVELARRILKKINKC